MSPEIGCVVGLGRRASGIWSCISEFCLSQPAWTSTPKSTEQNLIVCSGKSEAKVTDCAPCIVLLKLATGRHEASCDLYVTAEPLVYK